MTTNEPVAAGAIILGVVQAAIALLTAFNVGLTVGQIGAIEGATVALTAAVAFLVRAHVTPTAKVVVPVPAVGA